jgi:hypothetical protein
VLNRLVTTLIQAYSPATTTWLDLLSQGSQVNIYLPWPSKPPTCTHYQWWSGIYDWYGHGQRMNWKRERVAYVTWDRHENQQHFKKVISMNHKKPYFASYERTRNGFQDVTTLNQLSRNDSNSWATLIHTSHLDESHAPRQRQVVSRNCKVTRNIRQTITFLVTHDRSIITASLECDFTGK